jgi:hypothetical protein
MSYMSSHLDYRTNPRIPTETLCTEVADEREQFSLIVELSEAGLRLQRPLQGRMESRIVQLEFELPEVDELVWAKGVVCFDQLWRVPTPGQAPQARVLRTSGVRVVAAATRHLRMLRDYVRAAAEMRRRTRPQLRPLDPLHLSWA